VQNRAQFIKISKDTEQLKDEMQSLKTLMSDLTTTLGQQAASMDANSFDDGARKRANRSSLANLEVMWNNQLQILWKNIEGSQKFLAAIPGRHVISESGHWAALDSATWKSRGPIHVVLLNDHLLIAAKKRKRVETDDPKTQRAHSKLIAVKCWPLEEIQLVDVANEGETSSRQREHQQVAGAVTVRSDRESYTFCSDRGKPTDKTELLTAFRRAKDELRRTRQADNKDSGVKAKERADYLATRDPAISRSGGLLRTLSKTKDRSDMLIIDIDGTPRNLRWVEGQIDELDIEIALQKFEEAVTMLERLRKLAKSLKGNSVAQEIITVKVDERANQLADTLTRNLSLNHTQMTTTQQTISHLNRLDFSARARQAYLAARTATIHARARQCVFEGDVIAHITNISYVYFTLMKNTIACYQECFPQSMMSACVVWAKAELDKFNDALSRALSGVEKGGEVWTQGLERARELAGDLAEVGVDFEGMVGLGL
jgi:L-fucose mutarotase/ribose pyranase (RbsD/FucU family)